MAKQSERMSDIEIRRHNRRVAFRVMDKLDREHGNKPGIIHMMREMVFALGIEETMRQCRFAERGIPAEAIEYQRLCLEYLLFEEGEPHNAPCLKGAQR